MDEKQPTTAKTPTEDEELEASKATAYFLFDKWLAEIIEQEEAGETPAQRYAKDHGVADNSLLAIMYSSFEGGLEKGLELAETLHNERTV